MRWKIKRIAFYCGTFLAVFIIYYKFSSMKQRSRISSNEKQYKMPNEIARDLTSRRDWHDYTAINIDQKRSGAGEQGAAVHVSDSERGKEAYAENGFNIKVSDRISLNRSLSDIRNKRCKTRTYLRQLPTASIVIPFHNEAWSTLFRSIHSILNRSPSELLEEIILVDDFSSMEHLKRKLDTELTRYSKVKLFRLNRREGLIRARLAGLAQAKGEVIVILDSHIEVTHNWLPPLLEPIALDRRTVTCPMIDIIDKDNFHYFTQPGDAMRGAFDWELYYKRIPIPANKQPDDPSDPFEDPVMAGGLFAVDRLYFKEIGQYDSGLEIWGGEQYELSFKVWMCGGKILDAPCSRVGHIYRQFMPYSMPPGTNINRNFKRVAEVWMDEYKEYFYKKRPFVRNIDPGDLEVQKNLRQKLKCKSFQWFMTDVAPDIVKFYPPVIPEPAAWGKIILEGSELCLDAKYRSQGSEVAIQPCKEKGIADQNFMLTWKRDIRPGGSMDTSRGVCLDGQAVGNAILLWNCHGQLGNQLFEYKPNLKQLVHAHTGYCVTADQDNSRAILTPCGRNLQSWTWEHVDTARFAKLSSVR